MVSFASGLCAHLNGVIWRITMSRKRPKYFGTSGLSGVTSLHCAQASVGAFGVGEPVIPQTLRLLCLLQIALSVFQRWVFALRAMASSSRTMRSMSSRLASSFSMVLTPSMLMM